MATEVTGCFVLMALSSVATLRKLAKQRFKMSKKTRYMESQINRLMFAEVIHNLLHVNVLCSSNTNHLTSEAF